MIRTLTIRADCSDKIGAGHVMRMIALGQAWQDKGGEVVFVGVVGPLSNRIIDEGFELIELNAQYPAEDDLKTLLEYTSDNDWICLDGYHFDFGYQQSLRDAGRRLLVMDDVCDRNPYSADIVLNQNADADQYRYDTNDDALLLLGTEYALLRKEFLYITPSGKSFPDVNANVIITLGAADIDNYTQSILEMFHRESLSDFNVKVIVGAMNPNLEDLQGTIKRSSERCELLVSPDNIPELFDWADLAISGGGSTCWELCYFGVPMFLLIVADNQAGIGAALEQTGVARIVKARNKMAEATVKQSLLAFLKDKDFHRTASRKARQMLDGRGAFRVADALLLQG